MSAIIFDVDDTLYDQLVPFWKAYEAVFGGRYQLPMDGLFAASRRRSDEVFGPSQRGEITMEEMYIYRIQKAFEDFQVAITDQEALRFQAEYAGNQKRLEMSEKMREILDLCVNRIPIGIITNGPSEHQWKKVNALGAQRWFPRENIFVSGDVGAAKPDRRIFDHVCDRMGQKPEDMYLVGDSYENDIAGAMRAGWRAIWLNRRGHKHPEGGFVPWATVESEEELLTVLQKILKIQTRV